jgi:hypothetical protein
VTDWRSSLPIHSRIRASPATDGAIASIAAPVPQPSSSRAIRSARSSRVSAHGSSSSRSVAMIAA